LRERKFQVIALSIIIGLGTGAYVGLSSTTIWRQYAFDESNENLHMFDLKMELAFGSYVNQTLLSTALNNIPHASWIEAMEFRVVFPVSVNASTANQTILVNGRIIGVNVTSGSQDLNVNGIEVMEGRHILPAETNDSVCIVEYNFAKYYNLQPNSQNILIPGGINLSVIGTGLSPEYFFVIEGNAVKAESVFCALFLPMETAQKILQFQVGIPMGYVNEALFLLSSESDPNTIKNELTTMFAQEFPTIDVKITEKDEYPAYKIQKEDIPNDQQMYFIMSFLVLIAAALGTFNLVSRVINSHRRQIGINMALGVPPSQLAIRYLIFSLEIAIGGVISGLLLSQFLGERLGSVLSEVIPFPVWKEWLVIDLFLQGAILGAMIPFSATIFPIWRATRVRPIQAMQTGYTLSTGKGAAPLLERIRFPGSIFLQLPFRNFARNPRRTFSTILGVSISLSVLIAILSLLNGGSYLLDREQAIMEETSPNRLHVGLSDFYNISTETVQNITQNSKIEKAVPAIEIPVVIISNKTSFTLSLHFFNLTNEIWTPETEYRISDKMTSHPGIIISKKSAHDLKVDVGDTLVLEHLFRISPYQYSMLNTTVEIIGVYGSQVRFWAFMDLTDDTILNCTGLINSLILLPKPDVTSESIQGDLFELPGYSGVQTINRLVETYEELIELFTSILTVIQYAVMVLALLMAFNTATINFEERLREFATMGAFGTPVRTSIWMMMVESIIIGLFGTLLGFFPLGVIVMEIFQVQVRTSMPEVNITGYLFPDSLTIIFFIGIVLVSLTPLLSIRRLTKMDLPSALRVIE
jgi:putative ABC transport system permease protein